MLFEDRELVPAHAIALEGHERPLQPGVQTQAVDQPHRNELGLGIAGGVAGVVQVVAVHGPDGAPRQLGKGAEPVARLEEAIEDLVGTRGHLGDHGGAPPGMERVEPRRAGECLAAVLALLQKVTTGIAVAQDALETATQELLVTELRGVAAVPTVIPQQPEGRLEKRLAHGPLVEGWFHVAILSIHRPCDENHRDKKPPHRRRPGHAVGPRRERIKSP